VCSNIYVLDFNYPWKMRADRVNAGGMASDAKVMATALSRISQLERLSTGAAMVICPDFKIAWAYRTMDVADDRNSIRPRKYPDFAVGHSL